MVLGGPATLFLAGVLFRLVLIDLKDRRLPDLYTIPLILAGLVLNAVLARGLPESAIWGAILGYLVFWLIGVVYFRARGVEGLGLGDAKLLSAAGAWLGVEALPLLVLLSAAGALISALIQGLEAREHLAFGPWLAAVFFLMWLADLVGLILPFG